MFLLHLLFQAKARRGSFSCPGVSSRTGDADVISSSEIWISSGVPGGVRQQQQVQAGNRSLALGVARSFRHATRQPTPTMQRETTAQIAGCDAMQSDSCDTLRQQLREPLEHSHRRTGCSRLRQATTAGYSCGMWQAASHLPMKRRTRQQALPSLVRPFFNACLVTARAEMAIASNAQGSIAECPPVSAFPSFL